MWAILGAVFNIYEDLDSAIAAFTTAYRQPGAFRSIPAYLRTANPPYFTPWARAILEAAANMPFVIGGTVPNDELPQYAQSTNLAPQLAEAIVVFRGLQTGLFFDWYVILKSFNIC